LSLENIELLAQTLEVAKSAKIMVILAMTNDSLLGFQCFKRDVTESEFHAFLGELLKNNEQISDHLADYVFVMEKSPIHTHKDYNEFREFLEIIYLPPHCICLSPIAEVFNEWKRIFKMEPCKEFETETKAIFSSFKQIKYFLIAKAYSHSLSFYPKCLQGLHIE